MHRRLVSLCLALAVTTAGCTDGNSKGAGAATTVPAPAATDAIPAATSTITSTVTTAAADTNRDQSLACDPLDDRACLLPWPNDAFTVADDATVTGRRLDIRLDSTPSNAQSVPIDPTDQNRADGFSPGSAVLTLVPGLSIEASGIAPSTDIGASLSRTSFFPNATRDKLSVLRPIIENEYPAAHSVMTSTAPVSRSRIAPVHFP